MVKVKNYMFRKVAIIIIVFLLSGAIVLPITPGFAISNNIQCKNENYSILVDRWNQVIYHEDIELFNKINDFIKLKPQIKLGDIEITGDGTLQGSQVRVTTEDESLKGYNGKIVDFYIDYSITNGWKDDSSRVEINTTLNGEDWKESKYDIEENYKNGQFRLENIHVKNGDQYETHIKAIYICEDPYFIKWDEDISTIKFTKSYIFKMPTNAKLYHHVLLNHNERFNKSLALLSKIINID